MDRIRLPAFTVRLDGARVPSHTFLAYAGAHQLTLSTALPSLGTELHSSYLGHRDADEAIASHLALRPDTTPQTWARTHSGDELPVAEERRRCLYDHALELQELLSAAVGGGEVTVDLADQALDRVDVA